MNYDGDGDGDDDDNKVDDASIDFLFLIRKQDEEEEDPAALVGSFKRCETQQKQTAKHSKSKTTTAKQKPK